MPSRLIRNAVEIGVHFALSGGMGRQVVKVDDAVAIPVNYLPFKAAINKAVGLRPDYRVV
jgi:hypothetical protein